MRFVDEHRGRYAVALLLRVLNITASTYYGWRDKTVRPCDRAEVDRALLSNIHEIWVASGHTYGADRVHRRLARDGVRVGRKRVERLMAGQGWQGAFLRRGWRGGSTKQDPRHTPAPDLVNRDFTASAPNRLWVADATRIPCGQGVFWLAAVRDAFSNRIVGWKTSDRCDTDLILGALEYGIWSRDVRDQELIHHSDKGSNYTSFRFGQRLADNGILPSMGSTGDSYDNALMENFFSTLKTELVYRTSWRTRDEAENAIFTYIDGWYNPRRIQRDLGYLSPDEYETAWASTRIDQPDSNGTIPAPTGVR
ncbi:MULTISPECIES: IS3 family transposase [unclassified Solwaraspora]|uniref:IS3 family transposase n=1 Tax=unclassified Solwaraspora TaxID=2627926 RepID=UPI00259B997B|nr:IS3 family transposase [Solwaraspora sp. WMMA2056]WJK40266.1 IS3 family transposase [Solwaraspora sp. WMMA2056]WJK41297.1 IS3 family transposase [Solwaraspora sp. WMMA2056]WJK42095.1 IS3 family transposase [Solwaraspora sp. WMMA2056]WJK42987.1 IS3 family transposase [Solwaraspora sp. WMMA2056]